MALDPVTAALDIGGKLIDKFWPDAGQAEKDKMNLMLVAMQSQTDTNKAEASSASMFVAGWRPFVGWICGVAFGVQFVAGPLFTWIAALAGHPVVFPQLDVGMMMPLLLGMLGLGGLRTAEKIKGVNAGH